MMHYVFFLMCVCVRVCDRFSWESANIQVLCCGGTLGNYESLMLFPSSLLLYSVDEKSHKKKAIPLNNVYVMKVVFP